MNTETSGAINVVTNYETAKIFQEYLRTMGILNTKFEDSIEPDDWFQTIFVSEGPYHIETWTEEEGSYMEYAGTTEEEFMEILADFMVRLPKDVFNVKRFEWSNEYFACEYDDNTLNKEFEHILNKAMSYAQNNTTLYRFFHHGEAGKPDAKTIGQEFFENHKDLFEQTQNDIDLD